MGNALVYRWGKLRAAVLQGRGSPPTLPQKRRSRSTGTQVMWGGGESDPKPRPPAPALGAVLVYTGGTQYLLVK